MIPESWAPAVTGFGLGEFRSIRSVQRLSLDGKITLLAGPNNSGKSNIIRFLRDFLLYRVEAPSNPADPPLGTALAEWSPALELGFNQDSLLEAVSSSNGAVQGAVAVVQRNLSRPDSDLIWLQFRLMPSTRANGKSEWVLIPPSTWTFADDAELRRLRSLLVKLAPREERSLPLEELTLRATRAIAPFLFKQLPGVEYIDAFRQIRHDPSGSAPYHDGLGLIDRLFELQIPLNDDPAPRAKFDGISDLLKHVLNDHAAELYIPYDRESVLVRSARPTMPLASLGTGIHQTIILAAAATLAANKLVCIEEPEVHLHPLLQRRLLEYLHEKTSNNYVIATHSAHLLDAERATIVRVRLDDSGSTITQSAKTPGQLARICSDLGYRPSDIVQSNAIIWVEGPSDRVYVRHWIDAVAAPTKLVEGIHYSIMFYGGSMISHLDPRDPDVSGIVADELKREVDDFISLRRLNRNLVVMIDSDKTSGQASLNKTKVRLRDSFSEADGPGFVWITHGYTVENYVPRAVLEAAVRAVHPRSVLVSEDSKWVNPLQLQRVVPESSKKRRAVALVSAPPAPSKNLIAREVVKHWPAGQIDGDLLKTVRKVVDLIIEANDLPSVVWPSRRRS
ncbi:ATP-dependent nuclease [Cellulosimicrobium aquatile]|uniref:ATP-dependent nuclease n=1 Tax=Cellulosimicrobium aquatile TaxID=1612203 RepID=UPI001459A8AB|nr:AAA family ATPase [Cellulosimicrobium aquatile]NMF27915.1 AAA family ATPase [Cellulosimicrobium aquatile]